MRGPPARVYPFLLAVIPVLHLAANNRGQWRVADLAVVLAAVLGGCAIVYGVAALRTRGR